MRGDHISLFSGVGMTDIAVERAGFETIATAEINDFNRSVLQVRFPGAIHYKDVKEISRVDWVLPGGTDMFARPLLISGGFPCQDISTIGAGAGIVGSRSGLWSEFARIIQEFRPDYVLIENSPRLRSRGMGLVLSDLHQLGYNARWDCIPAAYVGSPQLRDRIWIVAEPRPDGVRASYNGGPLPWGFYLSNFPRAGRMLNGVCYEDEPQYTIRESKRNVAGPLYPTPRAAANEWRTTKNAPTHGKTHGKTLAGELNELERADGLIPAAPSDSAGNVSPEWVEWLMGLPTFWTDPSVPGFLVLPHGGWTVHPYRRTRADVPNRRARLAALGNGLVPQVASVALTMLDNITPKEKTYNMSRTHRAHLATDRHAARAHTRRKLRTQEERQNKPAKACRKANRDALREVRKEYVR